MSITTTPYGFIPTNIPGCRLWFDGADPAGNGVIPANGASIATWVDKSGNGQNLSGIGSSTAGTFAGLRIVNFNSSYFQNGSFTQSGPLTIILIGKMNSLGSDWQTFSDNVAGLRPYVGMQAGSPPLRTAFRFGGTATTNVEIWTLTFSASDNTVFNVNGSDVRGAATGYGGIGFTNGIRLGLAANATAYLVGWIGEYIVYNTDLSISQYQQLESYLSQKWRITTSLPGGHPGLTSTVFRSTYLRNSGVKGNIATMTPFFMRFSPRQIPGLILWVDGTDPAGNGVIPADGATVSTWVDKSGLVNNATTHSGTTTYSSSLKALFFSNSGFQTSIVTPTNRVGSGFFVVRATVNSGNVIFQGSGLSHGGRQFRNDGGTTLKTVKENIVEMFNAGPTVLNTLMLVGYIDDGNNLTHCVNGNLYTTTTATTFNAGTTILLGKSFNGEFLIGFIHEVVLFNTTVTTIQRQQVESYLAQKWGLTSSLATGHLHLTQPAGAITSLSLANSRFSLTPLPSYTLKYTYTGSNQSFVVPLGVTSVNVYMWGAGGGAGLGGGGGAGCYVQGVLTVTPGETLTIVVGQGGGNKQRSFGKTYGGGGQGGGPDNGRSDIPSSQGGGRSAIVRSSTDLVTAAAGGGGRGGRGGRGRLVTGENGTGAATGGSQTAGGTNNGAIYSGGNANQDNSAGGGAGFYGGGGGGQDQAGGGGSCLTSNLSLLAGQSTFGTESSNGVLAPQTSSPFYNSDVAFGATSSYGYNYGSGGNGLVVISFSSKTSVASLTYSRLILSAWYGSIAYRFGLDVTTAVNNAFGGNPSNTITLSLATFTDPQVGTTKFTYIVYMFNGIQKFSSAYAEGTVLTFSSLT